MVRTKVPNPLRVIPITFFVDVHDIKSNANFFQKPSDSGRGVRKALKTTILNPNDLPKITGHSFICQTFWGNMSNSNLRNRKAEQDEISHAYLL